ncbi:MAG: BatB protein [Desulfobulbus propionicus]|nr:MAG: BatB protein [Desulfobulbus propionicus]
MFEHFSFLWPWVFVLLPLPVLFRLFMSPASPQRSASLYVPFAEDFFQYGQYQSPTWEKKKSWRSSLFLFCGLLIWSLCITALARPQYLGKPVALPVSGRNILLAVDISGSMQIKDFTLHNQQVDRLAAVKDVAGRFIDRRFNDNVALLVFGTQAYLHVPLTYDRETVRIMLNESLIGLAGERTAIGDALGLAIKRLQKVPGEKVIILLTDGANTAGVIKPLDAADIAAKEGIRIYTIGVGSDRMAVSSFLGTRVVNPSKNLDEGLLKKIAERTDGQYFRATNTAGLEDIYAMVDTLEPVVDKKQYFRPQTALFFWPLGAAFILSSILLLLLGFTNIGHVQPE